MADPTNRLTLSPAETNIPAVMKKVHWQLERWRKTRKGRERIPKTIWAAAGELARKHGVNQVSRVLRLEFNQLKRAAEVGGADGDKEARSAFVELIARQTPAAQECVLEVENHRGKLRVELKGITTAELAGISRTLWEMLA